MSAPKSLPLCATTRRPRARGRGWRWLGALTLGSGFGLLGCAPYEPYPVCDFSALHAPSTEQVLAGPALVPPTEGAMVPMPLDTVNVTDPNILHKIMVQSASARRTETRTLQVSTQLVNCTDHPLQVEGRTHFFDAGQQASERPSAWQRLHLGPRTIATYGERSTGTDRAVSYLIELREGR